MKINKKFLGILMALGLTFSLTFAASAATLMPSTDDIKIVQKNGGNELQRHYYKNTNLEDVVAFRALIGRALKKMGLPNNEKIEKQFYPQVLVPCFGFDEETKKSIYLNPKIPNHIGLILNGKSSFENYKGLNLEQLKNKIEEINKQNSEFVEILNREKGNEVTKEEFNDSVKKIKNTIEYLLEQNYYRDGEEKQKFENILKNINEVKFEQVKNRISKFKFEVEKRGNTDQELDRIQKSIQKEEQEKSKN